jgi:dCTP deaminase
MLQAREIVERLRDTHAPADRRLILTPTPNLDELELSGAASVDLRLGTWFVSLRPGRTPILDIIDQTQQEDSEQKLTKTSYVPFGSRFILHPGSFVLAVTLEWLRMPNDWGGYVVGRSSWGRRGLIIATATGVHPRFTGCLTLELANVGEIPIAVRPGMSICQIFFHKTSTPVKQPEQSFFVAHTRPVLGPLAPDAICSRLWRDPVV